MLPLQLLSKPLYRGVYCNLIFDTILGRLLLFLVLYIPARVLGLSLSEIHRIIQNSLLGCVTIKWSQLDM